MGSEMCIRDSKRAPGGPKRAPRRPQDGPRTAQDGPKTAQDGPKTAQEGSKTAPRRPQDGPRGAKEASKTAPGRLQEPSWLPDRSRISPGSLLGASRTLPEGFWRPLGVIFMSKCWPPTRTQKTIQGSIQAVSKINSLSTNPQGPINASRVPGGRWQRGRSP